MASNDDQSINCSGIELDYFLYFTERFGGLKSFLSLKSMERTEPPMTPELFKYLKHYGPEHFTACLKKVEDTFERSFGERSPEKWEKEFDTLIWMDRKGDYDDRKLAELAQQVDFLAGEFYANRMSRASKQYGDKSDNSKNGTVRIVKFFDRACTMFSPKYIFGLYNLGKALNPEAAAKLTLPARFHKLNEYSRLCAQLQNNARNEAIDKIQSTLDSKKVSRWFKEKVVSKCYVPSE